MGGQIARTDAHITGTTENNGHGQTSIGQCRTSNDNIRSINGHSSESNTGDGVRERLVGPLKHAAATGCFSVHGALLLQHGLHCTLPGIGSSIRLIMT